MKLWAVIFLGASVSGIAAPLIPTKEGTTWEYNMTQEIGEGLGVANAKPDSDGKIRQTVTYFIAGTQNVEGKDLLQFEMHREGTLTNTDLVTVDDQGIVCWGKINLEGQLVELDPPQKMVSAPLKAGTTWSFEGQVSNLKVEQHYSVTAEEDVLVPAGRFHAFHIHADQKSPGTSTIDRWFAPGVGIVKDVTTMRSAEGTVLQRISLALSELPSVGKRPEVKTTDLPKKLSASLATGSKGDGAVEFSSQAESIYARWQGERLREHAKIRVAWIAEKVEDVPADYKIDEASAIAEGRNSHGHFILSRPPNGWEPGDYRADFYVDDELQATVRAKIAK